jgi:hypothetical protein
MSESNLKTSFLKKISGYNSPSYQEFSGSCFKQKQGLIVALAGTPLQKC